MDKSKLTTLQEAENNHREVITPDRREISISSLIASYWDELYRFTNYRLHRSLIDPQDVVQETFTRLANKDNLETINNHRAYIYKITFFVIQEFEKKERVLDQSDKDIGTESIASPINGIDAVEYLSSLKEVLRGLPKTKLKVLLAVKHDKKSHKETAQELGLSKETVKSYMHDALAHCKKRGWN